MPPSHFYRFSAPYQIYHFSHLETLFSRLYQRYHLSAPPDLPDYHIYLSESYRKIHKGILQRCTLVGEVTD